MCCFLHNYFCGDWCAVFISAAGALERYSWFISIHLLQLPYQGDLNFLVICLRKSMYIYIGIVYENPFLKPWVFIYFLDIFWQRRAIVCCSLKFAQPLSAKVNKNKRCSWFLKAKNKNYDPDVFGTITIVTYLARAYRLLWKDKILPYTRYWWSTLYNFIKYYSFFFSFTDWKY